MATPNATVDVLIIGGGPAGLSAALACSRQLCKAIVFDSGVYRNDTSHHMHTVPTWDHQDPREYRTAARKELTERYKTTQFVDRKVEGLSQRSDGLFEASDARGDSYTGRKLILASGVKDIYPDVEGYGDCWGRSIYHCLFCHGFEESGCSEAGLLAMDMTSNPPMAIGIACMAKRLAHSVTIFTNGNASLADNLQSEASQHNLKMDTRAISRVEKLSGETGNMHVHFDDGTSKHLGFMAHTPRTQLAAPWHEALGLKTTPTGDLEVGPLFPETSLHGVFAAGDCSHMMKAVPPAISSGTMAAGGVVHQLAQGK